MINDLITLERTDSTQNEIKRRGCNAVLAYQQSEGRGRYGRQWQSYNGNLHLSASLGLTRCSKRNRKLTFVAGVALWDSLKNVLPRSVTPTLKWPNDLLIDRRKIAGLIAEYDCNKTILGIGLNIVQSPDPAWSTSLIERGVVIHPQDIACLFLKQLHIWLSIEDQKGLAPILDAWQKRGPKLGSLICQDSYRGRFAGLNEEGKMLLQDNQSGQITLCSS